MAEIKKDDNPNNDLFEAAFSYYSKGLLVYAQEFVSSAEDAEDIVSEVFANLWEKIGNISEHALKAYLFRATRNKCLDYLAHLKVRSGYQEKILREKSIDDDSPDYFIEAEIENRILSAVDRLPPQKRRVFIMHKFEEKSYAEIADMLDISPKTVDKHLEIATKQLREYLSQDIYLLLLLLCLVFTGLN